MNLAEEERMEIYYMKVNRLKKLLDEIEQYFGSDRLMAVARELTKTFEEVLRAPVKDLNENFVCYP